YLVQLPPSPDASKYKGLVYLHRAGHNSAPENTITAVKNTWFNGGKAIEIDTHLSKDNELVVIHDDTLDRTTNGAGKVKDYTLAVLKKLKIKHEIDGEEVLTDETIPTLEELMTVAVGLGLKVEIEAKNASDYKVYAEKIGNLFQKMKLHDKAFVSSFDPRILYRVRQFDPDIIVALAVRRDVFDNWVMDAIYNWASVTWVPHLLNIGLIEPHQKMVTPEFIQHWEDQGIQINAWTIKDKQTKKWLASMNVGYTTNCLGAQCTNKETDQMEHDQYLKNKWDTLP
ncbi:MAG: hypothetical protein HQM12_19025, partial [SAR324 cluster bacterium]|nr:hypothetical protein [SAR324 cluster bacterium]